MKGFELLIAQDTGASTGDFSRYARPIATASKIAIFHPSLTQGLSSRVGGNFQLSEGKVFTTKRATCSLFPTLPPSAFLTHLVVTRAIGIDRVAASPQMHLTIEAMPRRYCLSL